TARDELPEPDRRDVAEPGPVQLTLVVRSHPEQAEAAADVVALPRAGHLERLRVRRRREHNRQQCCDRQRREETRSHGQKSARRPRMGRIGSPCWGFDFAKLYWYVSDSGFDRL